MGNGGFIEGLVVSMIDPNTTEVGSPIWALARLLPPQGSWSSDECLQLDAGRLIEIESGNLEILEWPTPEHQRLVLFVYRCLFAWSQQLPDSGEVFVAPLPIRLWSEKVSRAGCGLGSQFSKSHGWLPRRR